MKHTAVYLRVSSKTQTVASQRREIQRYLDGHGITQVRWYVDEGVSGAVMDRPALDELKRAVFLGQVDAVVVYALDRLARNAVEGMNLLADWLKRGVRLVVLTLQIDFSGEVGQMLASLLLHLAQMERTRIRERQEAGIAAARASGKRWGGSSRGRLLKVTPDQLRLVLELADRGERVSAIARATGLSRPTVDRLINHHGHGADQAAGPVAAIA